MRNVQRNMMKRNLELEKGSASQKNGAKGERRAVLYLRMHGYRILERNYLFGHKEIDIIARKGDVIAFIEVKSRSGKQGIPGAMSVTESKKRNIVTAAKAYAAQKGIEKKVLRFDIIEADLDERSPFRGITHYENAF